MRKTKRILSIFLILVMLAGLLPQAAFAADKVAYVKIGGVTTDYSGFAAAWNAAVKSNNATVGLYKRYMHHQGENAYVLPAGKTVTVELNGNALFRNITESRSDGSVFDVKENATLIVYGGNQDDRTFGAAV